MRFHPWLDLFSRLYPHIFAVAFCGWLLDAFVEVLLLGAFALLVWNYRNLYRLQEWLSKEKKFHPPNSYGLWGEVFNEVYRLQKRNRKRRKRLGEYLKRYKETTMAIPDAIVLLDKQGAIEWWNAQAESVFALKWPQDNGQRLINLIRTPKFVDYFKSYQYDKPIEIFSPLDQNRMLEVRIIPYARNQRLLLARDVSEAHRLQAMRRDFVANASHEMRTPLTVLRGYVETMQLSMEQFPTQWHGAITAMEQQTQRMTTLIEELLMLSKLEQSDHLSKEELVDVQRVLNFLVQDARVVSGDEGHDIQLFTESGLQLRGNETELRSAFSNLLTNAVRYTPEGGRIEVRWQTSAQGPQLSIKDTGPGIAEEHIPRLTERFYRVDEGRARQKGGTGLGLSIVKHVLVRHNAVLVIYSQLGKGSEFICQFPTSRQVFQPVNHES